MTKKRALVVWALLAVATLCLLVATLTVWTKRQILDTNAWTRASGQVLANDDVRASLANNLVDLIYQRVDVSKQIAERLPPRAQGAAPVIAAALRSNAVRVADAFLSTPAAQKAWEEANKRAHTALIRIIDGKSVGRFSTQEGAVTLEVGPMLNKIATRLGVQGKLAARESSGGIVLLRSNQLKEVQDAVYVMKALSLFLLFLVLFLYALAIYLARGKRRVILEAAGGSFVLVGLIVLAVRRIGGPILVNALIKTDANRPAGKAVFAIETQILRDIAIGLVIYGLFAIVAGFLAGPSRVAVAIRAALAPLVRRGPVVVYGIAIVLFLLVLAWGPTGATRRLLGIVILGGLFLLGVEVWRRQILREFPADYPGKTGWAALWPGRSASAAETKTAEARVDAIERLARLHTSGALSDAEYGAEKAKLLGAEPSVAAPPQPAGP